MLNYFRKFPIIRQLDSIDCGPSCLQMIALFYGKRTNISSLKEKSYISKDGVTLLGISEAAKSIGMEVKSVKITWEQLLCDVDYPCILHWNQKHFVVLYKIRKIKTTKPIIYIADPAHGKIKYCKNEFLKFWIQFNDASNAMGIALLLSPTNEFYNHSNNYTKKNIIKFISPYLLRYKKLIFQLISAMLISSVISFFLPFLTQSVVDIGIGEDNLNFVIVILIAQIMLSIGALVNNIIKNWLMLHISSRVSIGLISDFLYKLVNLPMSFFDSKRFGDIIQRIGDSSRIQNFLTGSLLSIIIAIISFIIYSIIISSYNSLILIVFFLGSMLYINWIMIFLKRRRKIEYRRFQSYSSNHNNMVQLINGMQDIKMNNCENAKLKEWGEIQSELFQVSISGQILGQAQNIGAAFIDQTKNIIISFIAAKSVIMGEMSLGMMVALQYIVGQLNAPISQFISFIQELQDAKISIERLREIHDLPNEQEYVQLQNIPNSSEIRLENVCFQYNGPNSEMVIDNLSITIPSNKVVAIVGASGSGKTTLIKLLLGFYLPTKGKILLNNVPIENYNCHNWRRNCGIVMQDGYIFSDTISKNIGICDEVPNLTKVKHAAKVACIDSFIESLPLGYNTKIGIDGHGLSSGQKQRILIARSVYKSANYLFFDEATNSLDANNEKFIMDNLFQIFTNKTVIIVAHRLSTVQNADIIIVLDSGKIIEIGSHSELIVKKDKYYTLIKNQLELGN